jgi:hypothetical protein
MDSVAGLASIAGLVGALAWWLLRRKPDACLPPIEGLADPDPLLEFDLGNAATRNYLYANKVRSTSSQWDMAHLARQTMRFPYFQTMAHQPMHINHWIEIDSDYDWSDIKGLFTTFSADVA